MGGAAYRRKETPQAGPGDSLAWASGGVRGPPGRSGHRAAEIVVLWLRAKLEDVLCLEKARCCGGQTITIRRNTAEGFDVIWDGNVEDQNGGG